MTRHCFPATEQLALSEAEVTVAIENYLMLQGEWKPKHQIKPQLPQPYLLVTVTPEVTVTPPARRCV